MSRKPFSPYHGRKSLFQRILTGVAILLAVTLLLALVALFVLPNYVVYDGNTIQFSLPLPGRDRDEQTARPSADPQPSQGGEEEPTFVIEEPSPTPAPTPSLQDLPDRRTAPLGLIPYAQDKTPAARQGFLFTAEQVADFTVETAQEEYTYVAVYVDAEGLEAEELEAQCVTLASQGVDEIVVDGEFDPKALRDALPADVFHGYLSAVAEKEPFQKNTQQGQDYAQYCDRVYVPGGNWNGLNLMSYLRSHGFVGGAADIVTIVTAPTNANWSWAVLPR